MPFDDPTLYGRDDETDEFGDSGAFSESLEEDFDEEEEEEEEPAMTEEEDEGAAPEPPSEPKPAMPTGGGGGARNRDRPRRGRAGSMVRVAATCQPPGSTLLIRSGGRAGGLIGSTAHGRFCD